MDFFETVVSRCSVREYDGKTIDDDTLGAIVDAGRRAPTARCVEPWEFIAVRDKKKLNSISRMAPNGAFIKGAAAAIVLVCKDTKYYLEDGCAATQTMLLAAAALDVGACWIAGDKKEYAQGVLDLFGVPSGYKLVSIISLGYPRLPVSAKEKRPLAKVLHLEKF
jgi:nitroreductase